MKNKTITKQLKQDIQKSILPYLNFLRKEYGIKVLDKNYPTWIGYEKRHLKYGKINKKVGGTLFHINTFPSMKFLLTKSFDENGKSSILFYGSSVHDDEFTRHDICEIFKTVNGVSDLKKALQNLYYNDIVEWNKHFIENSLSEYDALKKKFKEIQQMMLSNNNIKAIHIAEPQDKFFVNGKFAVNIVIDKISNGILEQLERKCLKSDWNFAFFATRDDIDFHHVEYYRDTYKPVNPILSLYKDGQITGMYSKVI